MNTLKIENLSYSYNYRIGRKLINGTVDENNMKSVQLKDINLEINDGLTVILGPNGAGKSTLIKLITTLNLCQKGSIKFNNIEYKTNLNEIKNYLGYLPQNFDTYDNMTGREFLEIIARIKEVKGLSEEINKVVNELEMKDYIDKKVKCYSGGMKQKLGIAQILVGDSKLAVLDEPTVGLDPEQRNIIREVFPMICKDRILIITTHIVEDVEFYCKNIIVLKSGKVLYSGDKNKFIEKYDRCIWESVIEYNDYVELKNKVYILSKSEIDNKLNIRYIGNNAINEESYLVKPTLEDAYIASQQEDF